MTALWVWGALVVASATLVVMGVMFLLAGPPWLGAGILVLTAVLLITKRKLAIWYHRSSGTLPPGPEPYLAFQRVLAGGAGVVMLVVAATIAITPAIAPDRVGPWSGPTPWIVTYCVGALAALVFVVLYPIAPSAGRRDWRQGLTRVREALPSVLMMALGLSVILVTTELWSVPLVDGLVRRTGRGLTLLGLQEPRIRFSGAAVGLVLGLVGFHRHRLFRSASRPGPIDIRPVVMAMGQKRGVPSPEKVGADLATQLVAARLYRPAPQPGDASSYGFIEVFEGKDSGSKLLSVLVRMLLPTGPLAGYQVEVTVTGADARSVEGIVEVHRTFSAHGATRSVSAGGWDEFTERAAHEVIAYVLPRTREGRRPPWSHWQGRELPNQLFGDYQRAKRSYEQRHYDEALDAFLRCIEADPSNPYIRLSLADTYESLGLHIDSLDTRNHVRQMARRDEWPARIQAHYRQCILLGSAALATQLAKEPEPGQQPSKRDIERAAVQTRVAKEICKRAAHVIECCSRPARGGNGGGRPPALPEGVALLRHIATRAPLPEGTRRESASGTVPSTTAAIPPHADVATVGRQDGAEEAAERELAVLLQFAAQAECLSLLSDPGLGPIARRAVRIPLPSIAMVLLWSQVHIHGLDASVTGRSGPRATYELAEQQAARLEPWFNSSSRSKHAGAVASIDAIRTAEIKRAVAAILRWRRKDRSKDDPPARSWSDHYNAACVYAIYHGSHAKPGGSAPDVTMSSPEPGRTSGPDPSDPDSEVDAALGCVIDQLETGAQVADSGFLARRRTWVISGDPDLAQVRATEQFRAFEARYLPSGDQTPLRPDGVDRFEASMYVTAIFERMATHMAEAWGQAERNLRATASDTRPGLLAGFLEHDLRAWHAVREMAMNQRHWQSRMAARRTVDAAATALGSDVAAAPVARPDFASDFDWRALPPHIEPKEAATGMKKRSEAVLLSVREAMSPSSGSRSSDEGSNGHPLTAAEARAGWAAMRDLAIELQRVTASGRGHRLHENAVVGHLRRVFRGTEGTDAPPDFAATGPGPAGDGS